MRRLGGRRQVLRTAAIAPAGHRRRLDCAL